MDLSNKELKLLERAKNKSSVHAKSEDQDYLLRLGKKGLVLNNLTYSDKHGLIPKSYSLTDEGRYQLELRKTHQKHEKTIHFWYPTLVNVTYGIIGFVVGYIFRTLMH